MNNLKMVVFDVDGTLYDLVHHEIPKSCVEALKELKANGYLFVIATGRAHYGLGKALNDLNADYILSMNGGVVVDHEGKVISHHDFTKEDVKRLNQFCAKEEAGLIWKFLDAMYIYQHPEKVDWLEGQMNSDIGRDPFIDCPQMNRHLREDAPQSASVHAPIEVVQREFKENDSLSFLRYSQDGFDVVPRGINKSVGLKDLMDYLNLKPEEVACVGDNYNDLEMMETAGTAIAMGNAIPEVKAKADFITTTSDQDGIANALKYLGCID